MEDEAQQFLLLIGLDIVPDIRKFIQGKHH